VPLKWVEDWLRLLFQKWLANGLLHGEQLWMH